MSRILLTTKPYLYRNLPYLYLPNFTLIWPFLTFIFTLTIVIIVDPLILQNRSVIFTFTTTPTWCKQFLCVLASTRFTLITLQADTPIAAQKGAGSIYNKLKTCPFGCFLHFRFNSCCPPWFFRCYSTYKRQQIWSKSNADFRFCHNQLCQYNLTHIWYFKESHPVTMPQSEPHWRTYIHISLTHQHRYFSVR